MGKRKSEEGAVVEEEEVNGGEKEEMSYEEKLNFVSVIAQPMASRKTATRIYKLIRKAHQHKTPQQKSCLWLGLKNVQTRIRKGETGIVIFAGDVSPIDVICHLPAVCEEKGLPYIYVPARHDIGAAMGKLGGALTVLIVPHEEYQDAYDKVVADINKAAKSVHFLG